MKKSMDDTSIKPDMALWAEKYRAKHDGDIVNGRMLWVSVPGRVLCEHMTVAEFEYWKELFRRKAVEVQKGTGADCVVYATKTYDDDDKVKVAGLCIIPLSQEEYDRRVEGVGNEMVYTVYKR